MDDVLGNVKRWIAAMSTHNIIGIADEVEQCFQECDPIWRETNAAIFKLMLYLCHTANQCDKSKREIGLEIWRICRSVCSNLTVIPDSKKFFSSIYHITSCLLEMGLYKEAIEICDYILPGHLWRKEKTNCADIYLKTSHLWHNATVDLVNESQISSRNKYEVFLLMVRYQLDLIRLAHDSYSKYILSKILAFCEKLRSISAKSSRNFVEEFRDSMLAYISNCNVTLNDENKYQSYRYILLLINEMIVKKINKTSIESIGQTFDRYFNVFRNCMREPANSFDSNESCLECFNLYEILCKTVLKPVEKFTPETIEGIKECTEKLNDILRIYGHKNAVKWYSYSAIVLLNPLLNYWEECAKNNMVKYLTNDLMEAMMKLLDGQSSIFNYYELTDCRCNGKKCEIRYDSYNNVALRLKALNVASRLIKSSEKNVDTILEFAEECVAGINDIKKSGCNQWSLLWTACGAQIYNAGITFETKYCDKAVSLYCLLCSSIVRFEGLDGKKTYLSLPDPISATLHRLTNTHMNNGKFEEAGLVCALNGLLSHKKPEAKAYRTWVTIKCKYSADRGIPMLECLRSNEEKIRELINVDLKDYDLCEVCLREIKGLQESRHNLSSTIIGVLLEMERMNAAPEHYAQGVQLLGYHLLNFKWEYSIITKFLHKVTAIYKRTALPSTSFRWFYADLKFYEFVDRVREIWKKTEIEINSNRIDLGDSPDRRESSPTKCAIIIPSYSTIRITVSAELSACLEQALMRWEQTISGDLKKYFKDWEIAQTLHTIIIAGEYARLHRFQTLETRTWDLAYKLARELEDHRSIIYITSRSLSTQRVNREWIQEADKSLAIIENSEDPEIVKTIVTYRLYLAEFYFRNDRREEAKELFIKATTNPEISIFADFTNFLFSRGVMIYYYLGEDESDDQLKYSRAIVMGLYTMLSMDESVEHVSWGRKEKNLHDCGVMLDFTNNLALRMNSLLSFREITAHLNRRLSTSQKLGCALRVAECLKSICYIDLSRAQLVECEVKLHGLEYILEIEAFDLSMKSKLSPNLHSEQFLSTSPSHQVETVRDIRQSDASPILRKKVFAKPEFMLHGYDCKCFRCSNLQYQHLVFASTHIRAQLYSLQRNHSAALQHFYGALNVMKNLLARIAMSSNDGETKINKSTSFELYNPHDMVDFAVFYVDFSRFLKWSGKSADGGLQVALDALEICETYNLKSHPIYLSTKELIFEYRFENIFKNSTIYSQFTVPDIDSEETSNFIQKPEENTTCVTPARVAVEKKAISVRRRKTPPFLNLKKVQIDLTDDEPQICGSPTARPRRVRRKITEQDYSDTDVGTDRKKKSVPKIKVNMKEEKDTRKMLKPKIEDSENDVKTLGSLKPKTLRRSMSLSELETLEAPSIAVKIEDLIDSTEDLAISREIQKSTKTKRGSTSSSRSSRVESSAKSREKVDEVTEMLDGISVSKPQTSSSFTSSRSVKTRNATKTTAPRKLKKSASMSSDRDVITLSDSANSSEDDGGTATKRTSSRLRKKK